LQFYFKQGQNPQISALFSMLQRANQALHGLQSGLIAASLPQNAHGIGALRPWSVPQSSEMDAIHWCRAINRGFP